MTRRRRWSVAIAAIAVLTVLTFVVWSASSRPVQDDYTGHAASPTPETPASTSARSTASAGPSVPGSPAGPADGGGPASATSGASARPTWDPAAGAPEGTAEEVKVPQGEGADAYRLPAPPERTPVLTSLPKAADASHALAEGFPEQAVPVPDGADVQSSSIAPQGHRVIVGMTALSDDPAEPLLDAYVSHCTGLAWPVEQETAPNGDLVLECGFGADRLTVRVSSLSTGKSSVTATGAFGVED